VLFESFSNYAITRNHYLHEKAHSSSY